MMNLCERQDTAAALCLVRYWPHGADAVAAMCPCGAFRLMLLLACILQRWRFVGWCDCAAAGTHRPLMILELT